MRAALALRGLTLAAVAAQLGVSSQHLREVMIGTRVASARLMDGVRATLGEDGWAFVKGRSDTLDARPALEAAAKARRS